MIKRFAFMADSVAQYATNRAPIIDDRPLDDRHIAHPQRFASFDQNLSRHSCATLCGHGSMSGSGLTRTTARIHNLRQHHDEQSNEEIALFLASAVRTIKSAEGSYDQWLQSHVDVFRNLPAPAKLASAFRAVAWYSTVLSFAFEMDSSKHHAQPWSGLDISATAMELQLHSITALGIWTRLISHSGFGEGDITVNAGDNLKLPLLAVFGNPMLVVEVLYKAITQAVGLFLEGDKLITFTKYGPMPATTVKRSIKPLVGCLLSLEKTVSGVCAVRPRFRKLLKQYGDIIASCV